MTWITHLDSAFWKIESNLISFITNNGYRWEKTFIRMTCKDYVNQSVLTVDGEDFEFFVDGEVSIYEITDLIRSTDSGTITFVNQAAATILELDYVSFDGERESSFHNESVLPDEIPYIAGSEKFYVQTDQKLGYWSTANTWEPFYAGGPMTSIDVRSKADFDLLLGVYDGPAVGTVTYNFVRPACTTDLVLLEWVGRYGLRKSWYFKIDRLVYNSDKQLNLQTMENGYDTYKNKRASMVILHKDADFKTQRYLSDLVLSDKVYFAVDGSQVRVETNISEITERKRDLQFTINYHAYDTI